MLPEELPARTCTNPAPAITHCLIATQTAAFRAREETQCTIRRVAANIQEGQNADTEYGNRVARTEEEVPRRMTTSAAS